MTVEKALESFRELKNDIDKTNNLFVGTINPDWIQMAIDAMEKQIEKPWRKEDRGHVEYTAVCPCCGYCTAWSDVSYITFCPDCGQELGGIML